MKVPVIVVLVAGVLVSAGCSSSGGSKAPKVLPYRHAPVGSVLTYRVDQQAVPLVVSVANVKGMAAGQAYTVRETRGGASETRTVVVGADGSETQALAPIALKDGDELLFVNPVEVPSAAILATRKPFSETNSLYLKGGNRADELPVSVVITGGDISKITVAAGTFLAQEIDVSISIQLPDPSKDVAVDIDSERAAGVGNVRIVTSERFGDTGTPIVHTNELTRFVAGKTLA